MRRIKKIAQSIGVIGKILNSKSSSDKDTYSCDYINKRLTNTTVYDNSEGGLDISMTNHGKGMYYVKTTDGQGIAIYTSETTEVTVPRPNNKILDLKITISANGSAALLQAITLNSEGSIIAYPKITKIIKLIGFY